MRMGRQPDKGLTPISRYSLDIFFLHLLLISLIFLLYLFNLRLQKLHAFHGTDLFRRKGDSTNLIIKVSKIMAMP